MTSEHAASTPAERRLAWWMILSFGVFVATGVVLTRSYEALADWCDPLHEPPNTTVGRSIVAGSAIVLAVVGVWLRPRRWLLLTAVAIALHLMVFVWLLTPAGTC